MSQDQIKILGGYIYPTRVPEFMSVYHQATDQPHGHLIVDGTQQCPAHLRLRTNHKRQHTQGNSHLPSDHGDILLKLA